MARLTWQNVNAPSFAGVADSYRVMSDLLGRAAQSGQNALGIFQDAQQGAADNAILQRLAGVQDPSQFNAATILGSDGGRASASVLGDVMDRPTTLLRNASMAGQEQRAQDTHGFTMDQNARTRRSWEQMDAAEQLLPELYEARMRGDTASYDRMLQDPRLRNAAAFSRALEVGQAGTSEEAARYRLTRSRNEDAFADSAPADWALLDAAGLGVVPEMNETIIRGVAQQQGWDARRTQRALAAVGTTPQSGSNTPVLSGSSWASAVGLLGNESGGNYQASNNAMGSGGKRGHFGALQFGHDRLSDAKRAGVIPQDMTAEQFRTSSKDVQDRVADWHFQDIDNQAQSRGLDRYYGQTIGGVPINQDSIRAMAHLGGIRGAQRFIETGGRYNPADDNGTRLSDYGQRFGQSTGINPVTRAPNFITPNRTPAVAAEEDRASRIDAALRYAQDPLSIRRDAIYSRDSINENSIANMVPLYRERAAEQNWETPLDFAKDIANEVGGDPGLIVNRIRDVMGQAAEAELDIQRGGGRVINRVNLAEAAAIVRSSLQSNTTDRWDFFGLTNFFRGESLGSDNIALNKKDVKENLKQWMSGSTAGATESNADTTLRQNQVDLAVQRVQQIDEMLLRAMNASQQRPGMEPLIRQLQQNRVVAGEALANAIEHRQAGRPKVNAPENAALVSRILEERSRPQESPASAYNRMVPTLR